LEWGKDQHQNRAFEVVKLLMLWNQHGNAGCGITTMSWIKHHSKSEKYANQAEIAVRQGDETSAEFTPGAEYSESEMININDFDKGCKDGLKQARKGKKRRTSLKLYNMRQQWKIFTNSPWY